MSLIKSNGKEDFPSSSNSASKFRLFALLVHNSDYQIRLVGKKNWEKKELENEKEKNGLGWKIGEMNKVRNYKVQNRLWQTSK